MNADAKEIKRLIDDGRRDDALDYADYIPGAAGHAARAILRSDKSDADVVAQIAGRLVAAV